MHRLTGVLYTLLLLASIHALDSRQKSSAKNNEASKKQATSAKSQLSPNVCPSFGGGLYILPDQGPLSQASSRCLSVGLGLANLTFSNNFVASQLMVQCGAGLAWISSFERVRSNTCALLTGDGNVFFASGQACQTQSHAVVCQDFAGILTDTTTTTFPTCTTSVETETEFVVATSTSTVVITTTSTASVKRHCPSCLQTSTVFLPGGVTTLTLVTSTTSTITLMEKGGMFVHHTVIPTTTVAVQERPPKELVVVQADDEKDVELKRVEDCPMSVPACQGDTEFVLLRTYLSRARAECSCRRLGMKLANINSGNIERARGAIEKCQQPSGFDSIAWVNSWQGDSYSRNTCLALSTGGAITAQSACESGLPALCQRDLSVNNLLQQRSKQDPIYSLCSTTQSNLFIVSSQSFLANQDPAVACATFNLLPANVFDSTRAAAAAIFSLCAASDPAAVAAQANSFDGLQGSACNLVDDTQAVLIVDNTNGDVAQNCFVNQKYFLCQASTAPSASVSTVFTGPFFFVTTTTVRTGSVTTVVRSSTVTVSAATTVRTTEVELISLSLTTLTSTTTTTIRITSAIPTTTTSTSTSPTTTPTTPTSITTVTTTATVTSCPPVIPTKCPFSTSDLVLLQDPLPNSQAECACRQHNMQLASLSVSTFDKAARLQWECLGSFQKAWIKSNVGGQCSALYVGGEKGGNSAAALPLYCDVKAPVLCEP